jgi:hypothetical protein
MKEGNTMKRIICASFVLGFSLAVAAADAVKATAWVTTTTTNEQNQITSIATRTNTNGVQQVIVLIDNDVKVPVKYRHKWFNATQEQKDMWLSLVGPSFMDKVPVTPVYPKKTGPENPTDANITTEVRETKLRW